MHQNTYFQFCNKVYEQKKEQQERPGHNNHLDSRSAYRTYK